MIFYFSPTDWREIRGIRMDSGAYRSAVPTPVIDPRFVNGVGVHRAPSGFSLDGFPSGACSPARWDRVGLPIL